MYNGKKIVVVLPAYNAGKTLEMTVRDLPPIVDEIILVDDYSSDNTVALAKNLGRINVVFEHSENRGYGANQKTCYRLALQQGADIIVMVHPDYQYDPRLVKDFVIMMDERHYDVMLGSRIRTRHEALKGGMPLYKYLSNRALTIFENIVSGQNLSEWHTGMRAYTQNVLMAIPWRENSDSFLFDTQVLFSVVAKKYKIGELAVPVRYFEEASSINFWQSLKYGLGTVRVATLYLFGKRK
jgi:glycosyltransferase involved in cell wall biosynthesis